MEKYIHRCALYSYFAIDLLHTTQCNYSFNYLTFELLLWLCVCVRLCVGVFLIRGTSNKRTINIHTNVRARVCVRWKHFSQIASKKRTLLPSEVYHFRWFLAWLCFFYPFCGSSTIIHLFHLPCVCVCTPWSEIILKTQNQTTARFSWAVAHGTVRFAGTDYW